MISIIIPAYNQLEYCRQCLLSLQLNTQVPHKLILVDNGSTDGVSEFFDSIPNATVVHTGANLGFAGGINAGLEQAEGHVLLLNSDTLVPRNWLQRLLRVLLLSEDIGIVGPMSNEVSGLQRIDALWFETLDEISAFADNWAQDHAGETLEVPRLVGFCMLIRESVWRRVGLLDTRFGLGNYEDDDYCRRTVLEGFRLFIAREAFVFHYGSRTFHALGIVDDSWKALLQDNFARYLDKWQDPALLRPELEARARALTREAKDHFQAGDLTRAVALYVQAVGLTPGDAVPFNDLGVVLFQLGQKERARAYFLHALRLAPGFQDALDNLKACS